MCCSYCKGVWTPTHYPVRTPVCDINRLRNFDDLPCHAQVIALRTLRFDKKFLWNLSGYFLSKPNPYLFRLESLPIRMLFSDWKTMFQSSVKRADSGFERIRIFPIRILWDSNLYNPDPTGLESTRILKDSSPSRFGILNAHRYMTL